LHPCQKQNTSALDVRIPFIVEKIKARCINSVPGLAQIFGATKPKNLLPMKKKLRTVKGIGSENSPTRILWRIVENLQTGPTKEHELKR
jgi:hypothetical protein